MESVSKLAERMGGIREYIANALGSRGTISRCGWLVAMVACMFVAVGCATDKRSAELIAYAEEIAMELPDSALRVVQSIDPESVRGRHDRAHYKLVVAEAHYYNRLAVDRDTIAQPLFDYYIESDNHAERARALYQHALVMQAEGENARAMFSLMEAEKSLTHLDNPRLSGLVHRTKGHIYGVECLHKNALEEYQISANYFDKADLVYHSIYSKYYIAYSFAELRQYDKAIEIFSAIEALSQSASYTTMLTDIRRRLCFIYIEIGDLKNCEIVYNRISYIGDKSACDYYCIGATISAYKKEFEQADLLYNKAKDGFITNSMNLLYSRFRILQFKGDYQGALEAYMECIDQQDRNVLIAINDSVLYDEIDFIESELAHNISIQKRNRVISALSIALLTAACILIAIIFLNKLKKSRDQIAILKDQVESTISDLRKKQNSIKLLTANEQEQRISLSKVQRQLNGLIYNNLQNIDSLLDAYYSDATKNVKREQLIKVVDNYVRDFASNENGYITVERLVNEFRNNIMVKLREEMPNLKEEEYRLLCLIYADFSSNAICLFMGYDKNKLYKRKNYLKGILTSSECKSKKEFIRFL